MGITRFHNYIFLSFVFAASVTDARAEYIDSTRYDAVHRVHEALFNDRFSDARAVSLDFQKAHPEEPLGYLLEAATLAGEMTVMEENLYPDRLHQLVDTVIAMTSRIAETASPRTKAWMMLFRGEAIAYQAIWESHFGSMTKAIRLAFSGRSCYSDGLNSDSALYDLYLGLGLYHYWKSVKAGPLRWLRIFRNDIQRGLREIYLAADSSKLMNDLARSSLIYVWENRKEYDSVIAICTEIQSRYPDGSNPLWPLANAYFQKDQFDSAFEVYSLLRERVSNRIGNYYNLIECDHRLYECLAALEHLDEAKAAAARVVGYYADIPKETRSKLRSKIEFLRRAAER